MSARQPPRLLVRALVVTFSTVAVLLAVVFGVVRTTVRDQVRRTVAQNLDASQRMLAALEDRQNSELRMQAATLVENPTLKAAVDTYAAESSLAPAGAASELLSTMQRELDKVAAQLGSDAVALVDVEGRTLGTAGPLGNEWARSRPLARTQANDDISLVDTGSTLLRVISVPLTLGDGATIGRLDVGRALDRRYAEMLDRMSGDRIAVLHDGSVSAGTLAQSASHDFEQSVRGTEPARELVLDGAPYAYREIAHTGAASVYALSSIDDAAAPALARLNAVLAALALGTFMLALLGSIWLARLLTRPIEGLSDALGQMAAAREWTRALPPSRSSRELDMLTSTFNALMASVADAESRTEAAYSGAIRALAAALDARDPYTAGHSERVSVLSVAIGRILDLEHTDLEVLRLGALLHDIGKIGISDQVLRKAGPLTADEYGAIMTHPVVGARILRTIPFLTPHLDIVELHHERPDGLGYPKGLRGDDIPLVARIVHVADAYDAITSARAYRVARSSSEALAELWRFAGTEYHAEIVGALARALPQVAVLERDRIPEPLSA